MRTSRAAPPATPRAVVLAMPPATSARPSRPLRVCPRRYLPPPFVRHTARVGFCRSYRVARSGSGLPALASTIMRQRRIHQCQPRPLMQGGQRHAASVRPSLAPPRRGRSSVEPSAPRQAGCLHVKAGKGTGDMRCIGRGKGCSPNSQRLISRSTAPSASCVAAISAIGVGPILMAFCASLVSERVSQPAPRPASPETQSGRGPYRHRQLQLVLHAGDDHRMLRCQQCQRHRPTRAKCHATLAPPQLPAPRCHRPAHRCGSPPPRPSSASRRPVPPRRAGAARHSVERRCRLLSRRYRRLACVRSARKPHPSAGGRPGQTFLLALCG